MKYIDIGPDSKIIDEVSRAVIVEEFADDNSIILSEEQKFAMMNLIKESAEWGRDHLKRKYYSLTDNDFDKLISLFNEDISPDRRFDPEQRAMYLSVIKYLSQKIMKWIKEVKS